MPEIQNRTIPQPRKDNDAELAVRDAYRTAIEKAFFEMMDSVRRGNPIEAEENFTSAHSIANLTKKKALKVIGAMGDEYTH